jgi:hypothetical protein
LLYGEAGQEGAWRTQEEDEGAFRLARRKSARSRLMRRLGRWFSGVELCCEGCCEFLLCFEEERTQARGDKWREDASLSRVLPRTFETVETNRIVGSVGRCRSFDAGFLPICSCSAERWKSVDRAIREDKPLPPAKLYKLGERYFVVDGNHRVSVARHRGMPVVEALVTELPAP